jgi:signal transduction histidine kinase
MISATETEQAVPARIAQAKNTTISAVPEDWQRCIDSAGWLSTSILHDLRNPLATICAGSEFLMYFDGTSPRVKQLATNINRAAERLIALLKALTDVAGGKQLQPEVCNVSDVITAAYESAAMAAQNRRVFVAIEIARDIRVPMIRAHMERVFFNLISNSFDAMPNGGNIRIAGSRSGSFFRIEFEDDGPGIPATIRARLFEPFVTAAKQNGLGLGLALARRMVLEQGGDLWIEQSAGCRFVMHLRLEDTGDGGEGAAGAAFISPAV